MNTLASTPKLKLRKTVVTRFTKPNIGQECYSTLIPTLIPTLISLL